MPYLNLAVIVIGRQNGTSSMLVGACTVSFEPINCMLSHATSNDQRIDPSLALYSRGSNVPVTHTSRPLLIAPCCASLSTDSASRPNVEQRYHAVLSWSPRRRLTARLKETTRDPDGVYFDSGSLPSRPINCMVERFAMLTACPF